jgi:hypothetical protein
VSQLLVVLQIVQQLSWIGKPGAGFHSLPALEE